MVEVYAEQAAGNSTAPIVEDALMKVVVAITGEDLVQEGRAEEEQVEEEQAVVGEDVEEQAEVREDVEETEGEAVGEEDVEEEVVEEGVVEAEAVEEIDLALVPFEINWLLLIIKDSIFDYWIHTKYVSGRLANILCDDLHTVLICMGGKQSISFLSEPKFTANLKFLYQTYQANVAFIRQSNLFASRNNKLEEAVQRYLQDQHGYEPQSR